MMCRVSVSSNTSSVASGGSPIHSTECVSHGFGGFSMYCISISVLCATSDVMKQAGALSFTRKWFRLPVDMKLKGGTCYEQHYILRRRLSCTSTDHLLFEN